MRHLIRITIASGLLAILLGGGCTQLPAPAPLPPGKNFQGLWDTNWGQMRLAQLGERVQGMFSGFRNGSVNGRAEGNLFVFKWTQQEGQQWGHGYLQMSPDGERMEGRWGYLEDDRNGGRWWASRTH